ncbi:MAG: nucleotide exchange factor GrpE [Parcubacteria group bacterium]|jgi:nucleoside triphosphatase
MEDKENRKYPEPIVGALIMDDEGKIFLAKSHKWKGKYTIPGGHVEMLEKIKEAVEREVKEETNLDVEMVDYIGAEESINNKGFHEERHFIFIDILCVLKGGKDDLKLNDEFDGEFVWIDPKKSVELDLAEGAKKIVENYLKYKKREEYLDSWKRCQADFENYKKRQAEMLKDTYKYANQGLIQEVLPVLDNFHASTEHVPSDQKDEPWVTGIMHIQKQLEKVLEDNNVSEIKIKKGDKFNPEVMEAIKQETKNNEQGTGEECKNIVKQVVARGYKIGERVIRAARVVVE